SLAPAVRQFEVEAPRGVRRQVVAPPGGARWTVDLDRAAHGCPRDRSKVLVEEAAADELRTLAPERHPLLLRASGEERRRKEERGGDKEGRNTMKPDRHAMPPARR